MGSKQKYGDLTVMNGELTVNWLEIWGYGVVMGPGLGSANLQQGAPRLPSERQKISGFQLSITRYTGVKYQLLFFGGKKIQQNSIRAFFWPTTDISR